MIGLLLENMSLYDIITYMRGDYMNVILISSESKILMDEKIKEITKKAVNLVTYNALEASLQDIMEEASYVSLFDEMKYVIVKNAHYFGKGKINEKESEMLLSYLENPYPCTTLVFTTYEGVDKRKNITKKIIESFECIECKVPKNYELTQEMKRKLSNYKIDDKTIRYIQDACLGNYDLVMNEIAKIKDYFKMGEVLSLGMIQDIVSGNVDDNVFKFVDAVVQKNFKITFSFLEEYLALKGDVFLLQNMLIREYRLILYYLLYSRQKKNVKEIASELKLQDWQMKKVMEEASHYHINDIKDILIQLSLMDYHVKSGQQDKNMTMYSFLMNVLEY